VYLRRCQASCDMHTHGRGAVRICICITYRFREVREEEGERRYRLKSRTARRQRVHAIDRPSFIGMCIAILPQFRRTSFGTPFSTARRRQSDIRYRATITPFISPWSFHFLSFPLGLADRASCLFLANASSIREFLYYDIFEYIIT